MDTSNLTIDLKSVAGIVTLTILLVNYIKGWLGQQPYLRRIPVAAYVVVVSAALTLLVNEFTLAAGDRGSLLVQTFGQALAASGLLEWLRAGLKPTSATEAARSQPTSSGSTTYLIPLLLAVALSSSACAGKTKAIAVQADATLNSILTTVQSAADAITRADCQPVQPCLTPAARRELSPSLLKALRLGRAFNGAVSASSPMQAIGPLMDALRELRSVIERLVPAAARAALLQNLDQAIGLVPAGGQ